MDFEPPILIFKKKDKNLYSYKNKRLLCDKNRLSFYKDTEIIDAKGRVFRVKKVVPVGGIRLLDSVKTLSAMIEVSPELKDSPEEITLEEVKSRIKAHVAKYPKHWSSLDTVEGISSMVNEKANFKDLFKLFR